MRRSAELAWALVWRFRFDVLAILVVAAGMAVAVDHIGLQTISDVVPLMGIVVAIFIGFRNRNAYNRWWEARTLWGTVVGNARSLHYAQRAYEDGTPEMAAITDRIRRREARHAWTLAAEMHHTPSPTAPNPFAESLRSCPPDPFPESLRSCPPEDPAGCTPTDLLRRQAVDIAELSHAGMIDRQARRVLVTLNSAQAAAAAGLYRINTEPIPRFYALFTRALAWFFAVIVCTRLDAGGHDNAVGLLLSILVMAMVVIAERLGGLLEQPMSDDVFGLPLDRFCSTLTADLLEAPHSAARN
jgi:putative membrane protein